MSQPWIETNSGIKFEFLAPKQSQININDIAHGLSMNCRFIGQSNRFYSVAEHSWIVARMLEGFPVDIQLAGLLHDASEAYITDVAGPVKRYIDGYQEMETNIQEAIMNRYGLEFPLHPAIKVADQSALSVEAWHLLPSRGEGWPWSEGRRPRVIDTYRPACFDPQTAKEVFLDKYEELTTAMRAMKIATGRIDNERTQGAN